MQAQFQLENVKERDQLGDLGLDSGVNIEVDLRWARYWCTDWIQEADDRADVVNLVMSISAPLKTGNIEQLKHYRVLK
jgi:hypothetical protein